MPSFYARNLARIFAASYMAKKSEHSAPRTPSNNDYIAKGVSAWDKFMRWLLPFVKASGYSIIIENPKSHEKIVINKDTKVFPYLSSSWLKQYNKQELAKWMTRKEKVKEARQIAGARGRAKYGDGYKATSKDIQDVLNNL